MNRKQSSNQGFTAVETLIAVIVAALFIILLNALYTAVTRASATARNRADASDIAYDKLRTYAYGGATPTWFTCDTTTGSANTNDLTVNPNATGQSLTLGAISAAQTAIPQPVTYSVVALAPYGCNNSNAQSPIMVRSTVTYGPNHDTITHTEYVGYVCAKATSAVNACVNTAGMIAWWPFDGDALDYSGNHNDGTIYGATPTTGQGNTANTAYSFDGLSDYISSSKPLLNGLTTYSFGGWMYYSAGQATKAGFAGQNNSVENYFANGTDSRFYQGGATTTCTYLALNTWHFIYITFDGTSTRQYADGTQCDASNNSRADSPYFFNIGGGGIADATGNWFNGKIDDIRIYGRALSPDELQVIYAQGAQ